MASSDIRSRERVAFSSSSSCSASALSAWALERNLAASFCAAVLLLCRDVLSRRLVLLDDDGDAAIAKDVGVWCGAARTEETKGDLLL